MMKKLLQFSILIWLASCSRDGQNPVDDLPDEDVVLSSEVVIENISVPWGFDWLPDGGMLVTDRSGALYLWSDSVLTEISDIPEVVAEGQGGLMDVVVHPYYEQNGWIYLSYSKRTSADLATTAVVRGQLSGTAFVNAEDIFVAGPASTTRHHYGSRLIFDNDGYLYVTVGDRGNRDVNPQSLDNHCGKVHRLNDDGSIPADNPFVGVAGAVSTIYSYGHRNPQGLVLNPFTGKIWEHEHGPMGGDEINLPEPGKNYGWPVISYGVNYDGTSFTDKTEMEGMEQPGVYWVPSIAPSGMGFVTSDRYGPLKGDLLVGSLKLGYLHRCDVENGKVVKEEKLLENIGRVRSVKEGPDGYVYLGVEGKGVLRLTISH